MTLEPSLSRPNRKKYAEFKVFTPIYPNLESITSSKQLSLKKMGSLRELAQKDNLLMRNVWTRIIMTDT